MKSISPGKVHGTVDAPPSKSEMQRALILAALAEGESEIANPACCDDALAALRVVEALGAGVRREAGRILVTGGGKPRSGTLDCGESGTCMRMITPVAALYGMEFAITGQGSLMERPMGMVEGPLRALGAACKTRSGKPPITVRGPIHGGKAAVDGSESSQFVSGLLMALPLCREDSEMEVSGLRSGEYVSLTASMAGLFGAKQVARSGGTFLIRGGQAYKARRIAIRGDWSGAAFILVAGAVAGSATVRNLPAGLQPDRRIVEALEAAGARVALEGDSVSVEGPAPRAFEFDATDCPDLFPPLAALACSCSGKSVIHGAGRLRHKESDRAAALASELGRMGAGIRIAGNRMEITGGKLTGGRVESHGDHRIAMACAVAGLASGKGAQVENESCVSKSYPGFFADLAKLGAIVE